MSGVRVALLKMMNNDDVGAARKLLARRVVSLRAVDAPLARTQASGGRGYFRKGGVGGRGACWRSMSF